MEHCSNGFGILVVTGGPTLNMKLGITTWLGWDYIVLGASQTYNDASEIINRFCLIISESSLGDLPIKQNDLIIFW